MSEILAAGAVVSRKNEVLLVHRPRYDDWSFPKGKLNADEHPTTAAVREVAEETGLAVRLGPPLSTQTYPLSNGRPKVVYYWAGRLVGDGDVASYPPNSEVDEVAWVPLDKAQTRLTYKRDRRTLSEFLAVKRKSAPLIVLRHGKARPRKTWRSSDRKRPLDRLGELQAELIVAVLEAYAAERVVSSPSRRCAMTLAPYAEVAGVELEVTKALAEEDATGEGVAAVIEDLMATGRPTVLCSHRPVLPLVSDALGIAPMALDPAELLVAHHRHGRVIATERHAITPPEPT